MGVSYNYHPDYESALLRGVEEPRPWDLQTLISSLCEPQHNLLDIGCGTACKLIALTKKFKQIFAMEPNPSMLAKAIQNITLNGINSIFLISGLADSLPFQDNSFDFVTVMLAPHNAAEIYRVLKPGGYAILETIGERDKHELKLKFGYADNQLRGQLSNLKENTVKEVAEKEFRALFSNVTVQNGFWKTYYTREGLELLLEQTPTIKDYNRTLDAAALTQVCEALKTAKGIELTQHRVLITSKK